MENFFENAELEGEYPHYKLVKMCYTHDKVVVLPEGIEVIAQGAVKGGMVDRTEKIVFPKTLKRVERDAFGFCRSIKEIVLPDGLEFIGEGAFSDMDLDKVYLPKSIVTIEKYAFRRSVYRNRPMRLYCEDEPKEGWIDTVIESKIYQSVPNPDAEGFNFHRSSGGWDTIDVCVGTRKDTVRWYSGGEVFTHVTREEYEKTE